MKADRRLWLTRDRDSLAEDGDIAAASLLASPGSAIPAAEVARLGLVTDADGRVTQPAPEPEVVKAPEVKEQPKPEDKQRAKPADKAVKKPTTKRRSKRRT